MSPFLPMLTAGQIPTQWLVKMRTYDWLSVNLRGNTGSRRRSKNKLRGITTGIGPIRGITSLTFILFSCGHSSRIGSSLLRLTVLGPAQPMNTALAPTQDFTVSLSVDTPENLKNIRLSEEYSVDEDKDAFWVHSRKNLFLEEFKTFLSLTLYLFQTSVKIA